LSGVSFPQFRNISIYLFEKSLFLGYFGHNFFIFEHILEWKFRRIIIAKKILLFAKTSINQTIKRIRFFMTNMRTLFIRYMLISELKRNVTIIAISF